MPTTDREQKLRARRRLIYDSPFALRVAAFSVIFRFFYTIGTAVFTILALSVYQQELRTALVLLIGLPIVWLWTALSTSGLNCLVCMNTLLKSRRSVKHRTATKVFGSFTLGMALKLIFARRFRCMHCGTQQRLVDDGE